MTIKQILAAREYADIFEPDINSVKSTYFTLSKICHPDICREEDAYEAFTKLNTMYHEALAALQNGNWQSKYLVRIKTIDNKTLEVRPQYSYDFECGKCLVGTSHVLYVFDKNKEKFSTQYINRVAAIDFAHKEIALKFKHFLPEIFKVYETIEKEKVVVLNMRPEVVPMRPVVENFFGRKVPPRHLAWMITRLLNLCCCFKYMGGGGCVHNGITLDNMFVDLTNHDIYLYGGWQYAVKDGEKMIGTTKEIFDVMPPAVKANKIASPVTDIESVKLFGRTLMTPETPPALVEYFNSGSSSDALAELKKWEKVLTSAWGERKFIKIDWTLDKIYKGD